MQFKAEPCGTSESIKQGKESKMRTKNDLADS